MSGPDHDQVRAGLADGDWDADIETHLEQCPECAEWADRLTAVLDLGPSLYKSAADSPSPARLRYGWIAAAAAVAVVVAGGAMFVSRGSESPNRILEAAGALEATGEFRFVAEVNATVVIPVNQLTPIDPTDVDIATLGRCDTGEEPPAAPSRDDLADVLGTLILEDPCTALDLAGSELDPAVRDTAEQLQAASTAWEELTSLPSPDNTGDAGVEAVTRDLVRQEAEQRATDIKERAAALEEGARRAAASTSELAFAESAGEPTEALRPTALTDLQALSQLTRIKPVGLPADHVDWSLLTTGIWTSTQVAASGSADVTYADSALTSTQIAGLEADPVGAIRALFNDPATLIALLDTAPAAEGDVVSWTVPDGVIDTPAFEQWHATVSLGENGTIDKIALDGSNLSGTVTVTLIITLER
jgi:predicted flap endonuclease-1-like 5' DNA nuclease